jgi:ribonuclease P protein component
VAAGRSSKPVAPRVASAWQSEPERRIVDARGAPSAPGPLRCPADFERVLQTRSRARSAHFAAHHLAAAPAPPHGRAKPSLSAQLSTAVQPNDAPSVDTGLLHALPGEWTEVPKRFWLGLVVPKRHARRAVTRSLLKRQIRTVFSASAAGLGAGLWVVRLRAGFDRQLFCSPASNELRRAARRELEELFRSCRCTGPAQC